METRSHPWVQAGHPQYTIRGRCGWPQPQRLTIPLRTLFWVIRSNFRKQTISDFFTLSQFFSLKLIRFICCLSMNKRDWYVMKLRALHVEEVLRCLP